MRNLSLALIMFVMPAMALSAEEWHTYRNDKYKYEIQHPDSYEVIITGSKNERDGRTIRIAMKEISRLHGIDIETHLGMSLDQILLKLNAPKLSEIESGDVIINTKLHKIIWQRTKRNGVPAMKMEVRLVENDELFMTSLIMNQAVITAHLWPDGGLDEKFTERIISTFKWKTKTYNKQDAGDGKWPRLIRERWANPR